MPVSLSCSAYGCTNRFSKEKTTQFFGFPKNPEKLKSLLNCMGREDWTPTKYSKICSEYFLSSDYLLRPGILVPRLKDNAVPSVFTGFPKHLQRTGTHRKSPKKRNFNFSGEISVGRNSSKQPCSTLNVKANTSPTRTFIGR